MSSALVSHLFILLRKRPRSHPLYSGRDGENGENSGNPSVDLLQESRSYQAREQQQQQQKKPREPVPGGQTDRVNRKKVETLETDEEKGNISFLFYFQLLHVPLLAQRIDDRVDRWCEIVATICRWEVMGGEGVRRRLKPCATTEGHSVIRL